MISFQQFLLGVSLLLETFFFVWFWGLFISFSWPPLQLLVIFNIPDEKWIGTPVSSWTLVRTLNYTGIIWNSSSMFCDCFPFSPNWENFVVLRCHRKYFICKMETWKSIFAYFLASWALPRIGKCLHKIDAQWIFAKGWMNELLHRYWMLEWFHICRSYRCYLMEFKHLYDLRSCIMSWDPE